MSRDEIPNLVPARCCSECDHGNDHDDTRYVYCRKYHDVVYVEEVCDDFKPIDGRERNEPR